MGAETARTDTAGSESEGAPSPEGNVKEPEATGVKSLLGGVADAAGEEQNTAGTPEAEGQENNSEEEQQEAEEKEAEGAPEEYAEFTFSEGFTADPELLGEFSALAKAHNLPQEEAQKYTAMGEKVAKKAYDDAFKKQNEAWEAKQEAWYEDILNDPEIGRGDPQRLEKELVGANKLIRQYGDPEFAQELAESGFGMHAGLVRMLHRLSKATASDSFEKGGAVNQQKSPEETWYGSKD